jgi:hypothetical protein
VKKEGREPVALFARCGFCFYDDTEFTQSFFWIVFFES